MSEVLKKLALIWWEASFGPQSHRIGADVLAGRLTVSQGLEQMRLLMASRPR
jgi:hypothetical protein